jgi:hypothetical protein
MVQSTRRINLEAKRVQKERMNPCMSVWQTSYKSTSAVKWFPGRGAVAGWIAKVELGFSLPPSGGWCIMEMPG